MLLRAIDFKIKYVLVNNNKANYNPYRIFRLSDTRYFLQTIYYIKIYATKFQFIKFSVSLKLTDNQ